MRGKLAGLCFLWPFFASPGADAFEVRGSVGLSVRENGDLYSSGSALCFDSFQSFVQACQISYSHYIHDEVDGSILDSQRGTVLGEYSSFLRHQPSDDRCYRARLELSVQGDSKNYGSPMRCGPNADRTDTCPIVLDVDGRGFHLSGAGAPVSFDLNADGAPEPLAWTGPGEDDGFLCFDRNGNGTIDDGRELFGKWTLLRTNELAHIGYVALADLDAFEAGGNFDGVLGTEDAAFARLCVWGDADRDGVSQPGEVRPLRELGFVALEYDYLVTNRRDAHGNLFRYKGRGWRASPGRALRASPVYDVILATP